MERWATVKRLHQAALDHDPGQRDAFLTDACAGDGALRREVESLLADYARAASFMESPALDVAAKSIGEDTSMSLVGRTLGHFRVDVQLGAGGMGGVSSLRSPARSGGRTQDPAARSHRRRRSAPAIHA